MSDRFDDKEYRVGYKKPPRESQFKKGKSGNPKGRPKIERSHTHVQQHIDVMLAMEAPLTLVKDGKKIVMPFKLAMLERLKQIALKGDTRAARLLIDLSNGALDFFQAKMPEQHNCVTSMEAAFGRTGEWFEPQCLKYGNIARRETHVREINMNRNRPKEAKPDDENGQPHNGKPS